jgi:glucose/mannose-6-phosphate isomerase
MLDQADFIARYDKQGTLGAAGGQLGLLKQRVGLQGKLDGQRVANIVLAGMGGSAAAGELVRGWLSERLPVPVEITRGYTVPGYVGKDTLVVGGSYSGTTEETLSALAQAETQGAQVVVMASGGRMIELAREKGWGYFELPKHPLPRFGVLSAVRAWAELLEALGLLEGLVQELETAGGKTKADWPAGLATRDNEAKQIAEALVGHPVVVYSGPTLGAVASKWKIDLNESAKNLAFWNVLPELSHNEFSGWTLPGRPGLKLVELRSDLDHERIVKRFDLTNQLLSDKIAPIEVRAEGKTKLEQLLWTFMLGSFVGVYLGVLNQVDPATLPMVDELKRRLG